MPVPFSGSDYDFIGIGIKESTPPAETAVGNYVVFTQTH